MEQGMRVDSFEHMLSDAVLKDIGNLLREAYRRGFENGLNAAGGEGKEPASSTTELT